MKISWYEKVAITVAGIVTILVGVLATCKAVGLINSNVILPFYQTNTPLWVRCLVVLFFIVVCGAGAISLCVAIRSKKVKNFVVQQSEIGNVSVSIRAIENVVNNCVKTYKNVKSVKTTLLREEDGIVVKLKIVFTSGENVPNTITDIQTQVKQNVTDFTGVEVREVEVLFEINEKSDEVVTKTPQESFSMHVEESTQAQHSEEVTSDTKNEVETTEEKS